MLVSFTKLYINNLTMSTSQFWQRQSSSYYSAEVAEALRSFRHADLADPISGRRWIEFGKYFSQMTITPSDI